jgi:hypothetical protein
VKCSHEAHLGLPPDSFRPRQLRVGVEVDVPSPCYLDDRSPVTLRVTNNDEVDIDVSFDVLLQPTEDDAGPLMCFCHLFLFWSEFIFRFLLCFGGTANEISVDDESSASFLEAMPIGMLKPGETARKVIRLLNRRSPGDRLLDLSVRSSAHLVESQSEGDASSLMVPSAAEHLRTVSIPVVHPFHCTFEPRYRHGPTKHRDKGKARRPLDMEEPSVWDDAGRAFVHATLGCFGPWPIQVRSMGLYVSVCCCRRHLWGRHLARN